MDEEYFEDILEQLDGMGAFTYAELMIMTGGKMLTGYRTNHLLLRAVEKGEVSTHFGQNGVRYFQYPAFEKALRSGRGPGRPRDDQLYSKRKEKFLDVVKKNPGVNGRRIRTSVGCTQAPFDKLEEELLEEGKLYRVREGASWKYFVEGEVVPKIEKASGRPDDLEEKLNSMSPGERKLLVKRIEKGMKELKKERTIELQVASVLRTFGGVPWWSLGQHLNELFSVGDSLRLSDRAVRQSLGLRLEVLEEEKTLGEKWFFPL
jgi:hypothetical protein